jgi:tRNA nucleotidyltransferase (CCA-adding enzyme)
VKVYRVGGSVRDEMLGRPVADHDWVVVGSTPEAMVAAGYRPVGRDFPVFLHPGTNEEYALARTERKQGRGYHGFAWFAAPDVTLEEDLLRRDLTINAMARADDGTLIDPFGGAADLVAGVLRHVSPAFAEDPLRVLRVARFAARFGFVVAPRTEALLRELVASGELAHLSTERVWQELARGLMEAHPSRMLAVLRECGALAQLLPEVDALYGVAQPPSVHPEVDAGVHVAQMLDYAAAHAHTLAARYAALALDTGKGDTPPAQWPAHPRHAVRGARLAARMSERLKVPIGCRDAAALAVRWCETVHRAAALPPARTLALLTAADAFRRPARLDPLLHACEADALSRPGASAAPYAPATIVREALAVVRGVEVGAVARSVRAAPKGDGDAIAAAVRRARLAALRQWRRMRTL